MTRTIKRGPPPRRPVMRRKQQKPKRSIIDRIIALLPVSEETLRKVATWTIFGATLAGLALLASWAGLPGMAGTAIAEGVGRAGLRVDQIEVTGAKRMNTMQVYDAALDQKSRAMPLVDLEAVRQKLLSYPWIADAHVSRRLPDTLLIAIVERKPSAVWQNRGQLTLISDDGVRLESVAVDKIPDLPLVIGPGAYMQETSYQQLLNAAPALKPLVKAATWVGNRRWDLLFESGETLALPAGDEESAAALVKFAQADGKSPLLGKGWVRFDMRNPGWITIRKPDSEENRAITDPVSTTGDEQQQISKPQLIEARQAATGRQG